MHSFEVHSNESACRKSGRLGLEHVKGGEIVWNFVKDHIIDKRRTTNILDYMGLIVNYLRKRRSGD